MPKNILIIDDNPDITQVVAAMLRSRGYETMTAHDGEEGLNLMAQAAPDLILCDIMMPGIDGFELFRRVRSDRRWKSVPFAFLTALDDAKSRMSSSELGVEAYITKPFRKEELLATVAGLLRRAEELHSYTEAEMESFKSQLLFMFTHELNTPLSVLRMSTDLMRNRLRRLSPDQLAEYMDLMGRSLDDLTYIVDSMLLALQIDSGRAQKLYELWAAPLSLDRLLRKVLSSSAPKARERHIRVECSGLQDEVWVKGHEEQLRQVFDRLLDNAIRFSSQGSQMALLLAKDERFARVTFSDTGPGMSPDEIRNAFDRLYQINRAQQEQQGIGLSLSLSRALVTIHGGQITVDSTPGKGSRFTVSLPLLDRAP